MVWVSSFAAALLRPTSSVLSLQLALLTLALVALGRSQAVRRLLVALRPAGPSVGWLCTGGMLVAALLWPPASGAWNYESYQTYLLNAPLPAQMLLGLALAVVPACIAGIAWLDRPRSKAAYLTLAGCFLLWIVIYAFLPIHLSAPDFDDFYVVDKFLGSIRSEWLNDKPVLTIWDYPYRLLEGISAADPLVRFRINGWFAFNYVLLVGLWLERVLGDLLGTRCSPRLLAWLPWLAAPNLGPVVLSHTLPYELACATWVVAFSLFLERLRTRPVAPHASLILGTLALAFVFQSGGHNATAFAWAPVYVHGVLILRHWRAHWIHWASGLAILVGAAGSLVMRENNRLGDTWRNFRVGSLARIAILGVLPVMLALVLAWGRGRVAWTPRHFLLRLWREPSTWHVWLVYLLAGAAIYFLANQDNLGTLVPALGHMADRLPGFGQPGGWTYGTNHARYALFFYPSLVALVALTVAARPRAGRWLALCALLWNTGYVVAFYAGPARLPAADSGYRRNSRFMETLQARLPRHADAPAIAYLPTFRDSGDHYLLRALDPLRDVVSACSTEAREHPDLPLVISGNTLFVVGSERGTPTPAELVSVDPVTMKEDILMLHMHDLKAAGLDAWCARERPGESPNVVSGGAHGP